MINLKAVRATGARPRVHGNGFIQLDLTERSRLHIWGDPRIPRQGVATPIHDHVFGFKSTILVGRLINVVYQFIPREHGDFRAHVAQTRKGKDTILVPTDQSGVLEPHYVEMVNWNSAVRVYHMRPYVFHETLAPDGPTATIIIKDGPTLVQGAPTPPRVLVPVDVQPDNDFDRFAANEDLLWRIIEDTLKRRSR